MLRVEGGNAVEHEHAESLLDDLRGRRVEAPAFAVIANCCVTLRARTPVKSFGETSSDCSVKLPISGRSCTSGCTTETKYSPLSLGFGVKVKRFSNRDSTIPDTNFERSQVFLRAEMGL